jgi:hypothetical protein
MPSIVHTATFPIGTSGSTPVVLPALEAGDVVVVNMWHWAVVFPSISSSPVASWNAPVQNQALNTMEHRVWWATGMVGATTLSITNGGSIASEGMVWVIRGLSSPTLDEVIISTYGTTIARQKDVTAASGGAGQVAVMTGIVESGSLPTFPVDMAPGEGWIASSIAGSYGITYGAVRVLDEPILPVRGGVGANSGGYMGGALLLFGTASAGPDEPRVLERDWRNVPASSSGSIVPAVPMLADDVLLLLAHKSNAGTFPITLNGTPLTAELTRDTQGGTGDKLYVYRVTGVTGSPTIAWTTDSAIVSAELAIIHARGLRSTDIHEVREAGWDGVLKTTGVPVATPVVDAGEGQLLVHIGLVVTTTSTATETAPPAAEWTLNAHGSPSGSRMFVAMNMLQEDETDVTGSVTPVSSDARLGTMMLVVGDPATPLVTAADSVGWL